MSRIARNLPAGEIIRFAAKRHWMRYFPSFLLGLIAFFVAFKIHASMDQAGSPDSGVPIVFYYLALIVGVFAFLRFISRRLRDRSDEMVVTNRFIVSQKGFLRSNANSLALEHVEFIHVNQSLLGRALNYGDINIMSNGTAFAHYNKVHNPIEFRNIVMERPYQA